MAQQRPLLLGEILLSRSQVRHRYWLCFWAQILRGSAGSYSNMWTSLRGGGADPHLTCRSLRVLRVQRSVSCFLLKVLRARWSTRETSSRLQSALNLLRRSLFPVGLWGRIFRDFQDSSSFSAARRLSVFLLLLQPPSACRSVLIFFLFCSLILAVCVGGFNVSVNFLCCCCCVTASSSRFPFLLKCNVTKETACICLY